MASQTSLQDTGSPLQGSAATLLNEKTARYYAFIDGWLSRAGRAHQVTWKAQPDQNGTWTASEPLTQTLVNL